MPDQPKREGPILVVDDDAGCRAMIREVLGRAGYRLHEAASAEEARALVLEERPSLAILDVRLPGLSGYEACRELRDQFGPELPIVFVSGARTESFDRVAGLLIGADDYVTKPFAPDELLARVRVLLRRTAVPISERLAALTKRELEVLRLLAEGLEQSEIARRLVISPKTVATHIEHILSKLGVHSRAQAVAVAYRDELLGTSA